MKSHPPTQSNTTTTSTSEQAQSTMASTSLMGAQQSSLESPGVPLSSRHIAQLQRSIGNQATIQLLRSRQHKNMFDTPTFQPQPQLKSGAFVNSVSNKSNPIQRTLVNDEGKQLTDQQIVALKNAISTAYYGDALATKIKEIDDKNLEPLNKYEPKIIKDNKIIFRNAGLEKERKDNANAFKVGRMSDKSDDKSRQFIEIDPNAIEVSRVPQEFNDITSNEIIPLINKHYKINISGVVVGKAGKSVPIMQLNFEDIEALHHAKWYANSSGGIDADITISGKETTYSFAGSGNLANSIKYLIHIKYLILNREAVPRSGKARAAADDKKDSIRLPAETEAKYAGRERKIAHDETKSQSKESTFTTKKEGKNKFISTITHMAPWSKGSRGSGQSDEMGGQNAKNHVIDYFLKDKNEQEREAARKVNSDKIKGRFEWLHIIGSSLGGLNATTNLVAGSYDQNTKMIALEHKVALWGDSKNNKNNEGDKIRPTVDNPITIEGEADVYPDSNVGKSIKLSVKYGDQDVISQTYQVDQQAVLTKKEYEQEEKNVEDTIAASKKIIFDKEKNKKNKPIANVINAQPNDLSRMTAINSTPFADSKLSSSPTTMTEDTLFGKVPRKKRIRKNPKPYDRDEE